MVNKDINGFFKLALFIIRRDRFSILIWVVLLLLLTIYVAIAFPNLYASNLDKIAIVETMENPAMVSMMGPCYGSDNYTYGAMMSNQMLLFTVLAVAMMAIFLVTRNTRKDEEEGRYEFVRSLPVGKLANIFSTLFVYIIIFLVFAVITGLGLALLGLKSMDLSGSMMYGAALGVTGIYFAAITSLIAQLTQTSRGTIGYSFAFLGIAYILRAIGDISSEPLSLISPLGLILRTEAYVNNYWWPILVMLILSIIIAGIAFYLNSIRDLGAGFISVKPGRKNASKLLLNPFGLAFRQQRTMIISWAIGVFILGASYGSILGDVESFFEGNDMYKELLSNIGGTSSMLDQFLVMLTAVLSMASAIPALLVILKIRSDEKRNYLEHILSFNVSRYKVVFSYLLLSVIVSIIMNISATMGLWSAGVTVSDKLDLKSMLGASIAFLPATWVMVACTLFLLGVLPRFIKLVWVYLIYTFVVLYFGGILKVEDWMKKLTPFGHVEKIPIEEYEVINTLILIAVSIILILIGSYAFRKRDIKI